MSKDLNLRICKKTCYNSSKKQEAVLLAWESKQNAQPEPVNMALMSSTTNSKATQWLQIPACGSLYDMIFTILSMIYILFVPLKMSDLQIKTVFMLKKNQLLNLNVLH